MLRACARVLKPGGRLAFFVIRSQPGLSAAERGRVAARDEAAIATAVPYDELLARAGFVDIGEEDVTPAFRATAARWLAEAVSLEPQLRAAMGDDVFADKQRRRRQRIEDIDAGLVGRALLTGRRRAV